MLPKVLEWLDHQGFSLEMRGASAFRAAGFEVRQSTYYTDPETNKPREMDVEAISMSAMGFVDIRFFVECKSSDKPWLLLCSPDVLKNYNHMFAFGALSEHAKDIFIKKVMRNELIENIPWLSKKGVMAAYSFRQAFSKDDHAYAAAMNVMKACQFHVTSQTTRFRYFHFAFPVIVVDAPLIQCALSANGDVELKEVEQGEFLFAGHELGACIRVVTLAHLPSFAKEAKHIAQQLQVELSLAESQLLTAIRGGARVDPTT